MKTFLFIAGLAFNLVLCFAPFDEQMQSLPVKNAIDTPAVKKAVANREPISYSALLKNKAAGLPEKNNELNLFNS